MESLTRDRFSFRSLQISIAPYGSVMSLSGLSIMRIADSCLISPIAEFAGLLPFGSEPFGAIIADSIRPAGVVVDAALL